MDLWRMLFEAGKNTDSQEQPSNHRMYCGEENYLNIRLDLEKKKELWVLASHNHMLTKKLDRRKNLLTKQRKYARKYYQNGQAGHG